jgi:SAM-dependent methyltransferase
MSDDAAQMYTAGRYLEQNPDWHVEDSAWKGAQVARILAENGVAFRTCVEVGCGAGRVLQDIARRYPAAACTGYDISPQCEPFWRQIDEPNVAFRREDFLASGEVADLLLLVDVFEHVDDYLGFLRALAPRAHWFAFHIPLDMNVQGLLRDKPLALRDSVGHLHYFSKGSALRTLEDCGYTVRAWFYTKGSSEAGQSTRTAKSQLLNLARGALFGSAPDLTVKLFGGYSLMVLAQGTRPAEATPAAA